MARHHKVAAPVHRGHHAKGGEPQLVSGNKNVVAEAEEHKTGDVDTTGEHHKKGGRAHHRKGGKAHHRHGGKAHRMDGGPVKARFDRPGRKRGGGVGANATPLSTAHSSTSQDAGSSNPTDTYGGTP